LRASSFFRSGWEPRQETLAIAQGDTSGPGRFICGRVRRRVAKKEAFRRDDFLTTTVFEFAGEDSLSWHLPSQAVQALAEEADSLGIQRKLDAVRAWL
jgi:hypothetical protein